MNLISNLLMFLLLMESLAQNGGQPPSIPYLSILTADDSTVAVYTNQSMQYSNKAADILRIDCDTSLSDPVNDETDEVLVEDSSEVTYSWKLNGVMLTPDNEFVQNENGSLVFIEPVYGLIECWASNEFGVSYSGVQIVEEAKSLPNFKFVQGPKHLAVPLDSTVKFNCESDTSDSKIIWTFNTEPITGSNFRIVIDENVNKQTLIIENVNQESVGTVGCLLKSDIGQMYQEGSIELVQAPGQESMIAPSVQLDPDQPSINILTDQQLHLSCEITGTPDPTMIWLYNGTFLSSEAVVQYPTPEIANSGVYTCYADNLAGSEYSSVVVNVFNSTVIQIEDIPDEDLGAGQIKAEPDHVQVQPGHSLTLHASYSVDLRLLSTTSVEWFHNNQKLESDGVIIESLYGLSKLQIPNVQEDNYGNYSCVVKTDLEEMSVEWIVEKVSMPKIVSDLSDRLVLQGTLLKMECDTTGHPAPSTVWTHHGQLIGEKFPGFFIEGNSLQIETIEPVHGGEYACQAANLVGMDEKHFQVSVAGPTKPPKGFESGKLSVNAGESLKLECSAIIDPLLVESAEFSWIKDGNQIVSSDLIGEDGSTLNIQYIHADHAGIYSCQVRTLIDIISMDTELVVLKAEPIIQSVKGGVIRVMTGGNASIECVSSGIPAPSNKFRFGGKEYSGLVTSKSGNETRSLLELRSVTHSDEGKYFCLSVNEYGSSQAWTELDVYNRTQILSGPRDLVQNSGGAVSLPCQISADVMLQDSLSITWHKNHEPIKNANVTSSTLMLTNLTKDDEGMYTCIGQTSQDRVSVSGRLTVLFEAPAFSSIPRDIRVLEGRSSQLVCAATGIPSPRVHWTLYGAPLESDNGILRLTKLSLDKEGDYECTAVNMYGSVSQTVRLEVIKEARKENENLVPDIVKNIKDDISLPCDFKLDQRIEQETRVIWYKDNTEISFSSSKYSLKKDRSLKIKSIELSDAGQYACTIITPLQRVQSRISLIVSGETPEIISEFNQTTFHEGEKLTLTCKARGVPTPTIDWMSQNEPVKSKFIINIPSGSREFVESRIVIERASKDDDGLYQCLARNNVGTVVKSATVGVLQRTKVHIQGEEERPEISVPAGEKLKLPCKVDHDVKNRITRIQWLKNGTALSHGGDDTIDFGWDGSISIFSVQRRHEGIYTCKVTTVNDEESAEINVKVLVNAPVITKSSHDVHMFSGESVTLECAATGIPEPEIRWTFNRTITKVVGPKFDIKSAIAADGGSYTCTASNSIGETEKTIKVGIVTMPHSQDIYQSKKGTDIKLPCVQASDSIEVLWLRNGESMDSLWLEENSVEIDPTGAMVLRNLSPVLEGVYTCRVRVGDTRVERRMEVRLMPDIVTMENTKLTVKEGENFTLKCDVLPGVNAKRMWNKDGQLVIPETGSGLDIRDQGGVLTVAEARPDHSGEWKCIASTAWGQDTIIYWLSVMSRTRLQQSCTDRAVPVIHNIEPVSNSSVKLEWSMENFNSSCFHQFIIFWWSQLPDSNFYNQTVELTDSEAIVNNLEPSVAYYFQVNLVRDKQLKDYVYGETRSHVMQYIAAALEEPATESDSMAVILVVIVVAILILILGILSYVKRRTLTRYLSLKTKSKHELPEMSSKLVMNPDFMASLAPQWPEPEPNSMATTPQWPEPDPMPQWPEPEQGPPPSETQAFLPQHRPISRRNSKDSLSSWSSLFNVVSNENLSTPEQQQLRQQHQQQHHARQNKLKPLDRRRQNH